MSDRRAWWESISFCWAKTRKGERCRNPIKRGFRAESGELIIFFTCMRHWNQENKIRKEKGLNIFAYTLP